MDHGMKKRIAKAPLIVELSLLAQADVLDVHAGLINEAIAVNKRIDAVKLSKLLCADMKGQALILRSNAQSRAVTALNFDAARKVEINWEETAKARFLTDDELTKIVLAALGA